jgi:hypothetical protein
VGCLAAAVADRNYYAPRPQALARSACPHVWDVPQICDATGRDPMPSDPEYAAIEYAGLPVRTYAVNRYDAADFANMAPSL